MNSQTIIIKTLKTSGQNRANRHRNEDKKITKTIAHNYQRHTTLNWQEQRATESTEEEEEEKKNS